jgi:hypothetical protein
MAIFLILNGCSSNNNESIDKKIDDKKLNTTNVKKEIENTPIQGTNSTKSLDKKFLPPNFLVKEFKVTTSGDLINIKLRYELSENLYKFLQNGPKFIFNIELPDTIINETGIGKTEMIEGHVSSNGELNYEINFSTNLHKKLDSSVLDLINKDELSFRLIIYDELMVPVHIFEGVQWADSFQYGKSENIICEDK